MLAREHELLAWVKAASVADTSLQYQQLAKEHAKLQKETALLRASVTDLTRTNQQLLESSADLRATLQTLKATTPAEKKTATADSYITDITVTVLCNDEMLFEATHGYQLDIDDYIEAITCLLTHNVTDVIFRTEGEKSGWGISCLNVANEARDTMTQLMQTHVFQIYTPKVAINHLQYTIDTT